MLVLSRKANQTIVVSGPCEITVVSVKGNNVRLGIRAEPGVQIDREEVYEVRKKGEVKR